MQSLRRTHLRFALAAAAVLAARGAPSAPQEPDAATDVALAGDDQCLGDSACALSALQLRGQKLASNASSSSTYRCVSDLDLGPVVQASQKGLALDDTTFRSCAGSIPQAFPNTDTPIGSLRLFKSWDPEWPEEDRAAAWANVAAYVKENGVKVLLGTEVTCNKSLDVQSWAWTKELLQLLGPSHVMGLAIGNELEILSRMGDRRKVAPVTSECITEIWDGGYFLSLFERTVEEFDRMGFGEVPVTTVLGGYSLAGKPFVNVPEARVTAFLRSALSKYGHRFVFTFNFYPYFDTNMHLDKNRRTCYGALHGATSWGKRGFMPGIIKAARGRVDSMAPGSKMWLGETGWSSPLAPSLESSMSMCSAWSSANTLEKFYGNFLHWWLVGVDHVFYFTARDSEVFSVPEHFGLMTTCHSSSCKLMKANSFQMAMKTEEVAAAASDEDEVAASDGDGAFPPSRLEQSV